MDEGPWHERIARKDLIPGTAQAGLWNEDRNE